MRHARVSRSPGKVHGIPAARGNNDSALCGAVPISGTLNAEAVDRGYWHSTDDRIDCLRCLKRLETLADVMAKEQGKYALRLRARDLGTRSGVCASCGRVRLLKKDGTMGNHEHKTAQAWKKFSACMGVGKPPKWLVVSPDVDGSAR